MLEAIERINRYVENMSEVEFNLIIPCCLLQGYRTPVIPACPESFFELSKTIPDKPTVGALKHGNDKK